MVEEEEMMDVNTSSSVSGAGARRGCGCGWIVMVVMFVDVVVFVVYLPRRSTRGCDRIRSTASQEGLGTREYRLLSLVMNRTSTDGPYEGLHT